MPNVGETYTGSTHLLVTEQILLGYSNAGEDTCVLLSPILLELAEAHSRFPVHEKRQLHPFLLCDRSLIVRCLYVYHGSNGSFSDLFVSFGPRCELWNLRIRSDLREEELLSTCHGLNLDWFDMIGLSQCEAELFYKSGITYKK